MTFIKNNKNGMKEVICIEGEKIFTRVVLSLLSLNLILHVIGFVMYIVSTLVGATRMGYFKS